MPVRASDRIRSMSPSLKEIVGKEVIVRDVSISERPMRGAEQTFVDVGIESDEGEDLDYYHAWSPSLAEKLAQLTREDLDEGVIGTFTRVRTGSGFEVWNFE